MTMETFLSGLLRVQLEMMGIIIILFLAFLMWLIIDTIKSEFF